MPDLSEINAISKDNVSQVDGVDKANIASINAITIPAAAAGATRVVAGFDDAYVGWVNVADDSDVSVWETNTYKVGEVGDSWDITDIAFGQDGNGDDFYVAVVNGNNPEIIHDDDADITDGVRWSEINLGASNQPVGNLKQRTVCFGNGVWVTAGMLTSTHKYIYRSTNGTTWTAIDISGLTDIGNVYTEGIYALTSNGSGTWWFAIAGKIYKSTDNAQTFALEHTVNVAGGKIWDLVYTNSSLVCLYASGGAKLISAAASDTTDWSSAVACADGNGLTLASSTTKRMAAGGGRVVVIDTGKSLAFDVNGKTLTVQGTRQTLPDEGNLNCICTDGQGNWYTGSDGGTTGPDGGDICKSTDNGLSWSKIAEGIAVGGNRKVEGIAVDVLLPV